MRSVHHHAVFVGDEGEGAPVYLSQREEANFFVKVVYEPPEQSVTTCLLSEEEEEEEYAEDLGREEERVVGVTNTEYGSVEPIWGTNANLSACPYNVPRDKHQVSGATRLDVVRDVTAGLGGSGGASTSFGAQEESSVSPASSSSLAFTFYVPAKHLEGEEGGSLRLHLCQNMFSLKAGIVDAPVGCITIPLFKNMKSTVHNPEWRDVEGYYDLPLPSLGGGDYPSEEGEPQGPPQVLVGVSVQARNPSSSQPGSPRRLPSPSNDFSSPLRDGPTTYGNMLGGVTGGLKAGVDGVGDSTAVGRTGTGSDEWNKVEGDSDSDDEVPHEGAAAAAAASTTSSHHHLPGSENFLSKTAGIKDCYEWMDLIGGPSRVLDTDGLVKLFALVDYPVAWVEGHAKGFLDQVNMLAKVLDVYAQRLSEGANFRSSLLKKEPLLQYVATNLHIQVWSIRDPVSGKDHHYDFVTTGAPAAHALGHTEGGLVTLQARLQSLGMKVMELKATRRECKERGGSQAVRDLEGHTDNLRAALLEFEVLSVKVAVRRACVVSQAISIAATSFCAKLEMMARGTLDVASDCTMGGCGSYDELAERWVTTGFLLGFEGLLSIHGKEHGMVEDTVSALDMLADYNLKVVAASPAGSSANTRHTGTGHADDDAHVADDFELEIGVVGRTIQCIVGDACLSRLPRALWGDHHSGGDAGGGRAVRIVPVLFTQGIDIQQSMSNAARDAREKAAFQAHINSQNLARLNRYCHRVSPVKSPAGATKPNTAAGSGARAPQSSLSSVAPPLPSSMPPLPRSAAASSGSGVGGLDDLLGLADVDISGGDGETALEAGGSVGHRLGGGDGANRPPLLRELTSAGAAVPEWMHPALSELETAVRDDKVAHKNTAILLEAQVAVRRLCGGRVTFCKSGKDRTAMSITLEEALLLAEKTSHQPPSNSNLGVGRPGAVNVTVGWRWRAAERSGALEDANVLRAHGARLLVAEKNIGRPLYSFNALQRQFIPELYQPPPQTIQDVITSALNRDS